MLDTNQPFVNEGYATKFNFAFPGCTSKIAQQTCNHRDNATCKHWHVHSATCPWVTNDYSVVETVILDNLEDDIASNEEQGKSLVQKLIQAPGLTDDAGVLTAKGWKAIQQDTFAAYNYATDQDLKALVAQLETLLMMLNKVK